MIDSGEMRGHLRSVHPGGQTAQTPASSTPAQSGYQISVDASGNVSVSDPNGSVIYTGTLTASATTAQGAETSIGTLNPVAGSSSVSAANAVANAAAGVPWAWFIGGMVIGGIVVAVVSQQRGREAAAMR